MTLRRLSADFEARWRHPVVGSRPSPILPVTSAPATKLRTSPSRDDLWVRTQSWTLRPPRCEKGLLDQDAAARCASPARLRIRPASTPRRDESARSRSQPPRPCEPLDEPAKVPDPRMRRGIRHQLPQILAIATLGTLRGATSLFAIGELAAELPEEALVRLGCRTSPRTSRRQAPEESTIRRTLRAIDADSLDLVVNAWVASQLQPVDCRPKTRSRSTSRSCSKKTSAAMTTRT